MKKVLLSMPRYKSEVCMASAQAFFHACLSKAGHEVRAVSQASSLATSCFNSLWAMARNEYESGNIDTFAMIHSDVAPPIGWLDTLLEEQERVGADVLSAVIPIKDGRGLTSTAVDDTGDDWRFRRLTMKQAHALPVTFTSDDVGAPLLLNTGLWVARLAPWMHETFFQVREHIRRDKSQGGLWVPSCVSEDWDFSMQCHKHGLKLAATRIVEVEHYGEHKWRSSDVWGWDEDNQNSKKAIAAIHEGFQFPADVDGWLSEGEGRFLSEACKGHEVLEIGSYCGRSTICIAQGATLVHAVDTFDGRGTPASGRNVQSAFHDNVSRYGCSGRVVTHVGTSRDKVPLIGRKVDVAFIDGSHDYASVMEDANLALDVLKPDGVLLFHDHHEEGVERAVAELVGCGAKKLGNRGSIAIVQPPALVEAMA